MTVRLLLGLTAWGSAETGDSAETVELITRFDLPFPPNPGLSLIMNAVTDGALDEGSNGSAASSYGVNTCFTLDSVSYSLNTGTFLVSAKDVYESREELDAAIKELTSFYGFVRESE